MSRSRSKSGSEGTPALRSAPTELDGRRLAGRKSGGLAERVRGHVYEQIVSGAIRPGSIIQIAAVAEELGVSRTPVREALLSLQQSQLVSVVPNQGFLVCTMSLADVRDIYLMRAVLEGATAERAATRLKDADLKLLAEVNALSHEVAATRYDIEFDRLCHDFHRKIAQVADSPRLLAGVENIFDDHMRLQSIGVNPPDPKIVMDEHEAIYQALAAHDTNAARERMEAHIGTLHRLAVATLSD
ncbi:GntR family transcriptional regulator [Rhodococcus sp. T2V]|uniref:GntR family transcriptional regulator n=1 Tax=Rhodococcus sp. T2V TaxID=3034164 RepID=UPI0023E1DB75|nr:GntR family transcriptional regulator [Rhodococcus sp. T2V]